MTRDPLQTLVHLIATETNPDQLVLRVVAEASVLEEARRLSRGLLGAGATNDARVTDCCRAAKVPLEFFGERLQLLARILNLIPYDQNYYEILGIERLANQREIKQAFRRLSFAYHPDTNPNDPNAAERFRNLQHAYEVLSYDLLRQRYDHNLGEYLWDEEENSKGRRAGPAWWAKWRKAWPVGLLMVLLVVTTFVVDYSQWQTERYYAGMKTHPARVEPDSSVAPVQVPVDVADKAASRAESVPETPAPEPDKPTPIRESSERAPDKPRPVILKEAASHEARDDKSVKSAVPGQPDFSSRPGVTKDDTRGKRSESMRDEAQRPTETVSPSTGVARDEGSSPPKGGGAGRESLVTATAAPPQPALTPKAAQKVPPPATRAEAEPTLPGKGQESGLHADAKQAGPTPAPSARPREPRPATPTGSSGVDGFARLDNLDQEIRTFLFRYTSTYEARDMNAFMRLFEANAIENGRPIQELVPLYQANFKRAEKLRYRINVGRWEMGEGEVMVDGSFSLAVQFAREAPVESTGSIQLTLVRRAGDFGVKRLNYIFKESRKSPE